MLSIDERNHLVRLLTAAEPVKAKLLSAFSLGPASLDSHAYAVKARVKSFESAEAKILDRRRARPSEPYGPGDLTDIIGVRLLCLWPDEIALIFEKLVQMMKEICRTSLSSFASPDLGEVINEVIVYRAPSSPGNYYFIKDQLVRLLEFDPRLSECVRDTESARDRPYSSVHMVFWCATQAAGERVRIPVEVQVRTALEDVWSEIDHRLKYKPKTQPREGPNTRFGHEILIRIKSGLDREAAEFQTVRNLLDADSDPVGGPAFSRHVDLLKEPVAYWGLEGQGEEAAKDAQAISAELDAFYAEFEGQTGIREAGWDEKFEALKQNLHAFKLRRESSEAFVDAPPEGIARWEFSTAMELALIHFWRASLARNEIGETRTAQSITEFEENYRSCIDIYLALIADPEKRHIKYSILWHRLGNLLLELGNDPRAATAYFRRAWETLGTDTSISEDDYYRSVTPRLYAFCLWQSEEVEFQDALSRYGQEQAFAGHAAAPLAEAIEIMVPLVGLVDRLKANSGFWDKSAEKMKVLNNLISFGWYYAIRRAQTASVDPTPAKLREQLAAIEDLPQGLLDKTAKDLAAVATAMTGYEDDVELLHSLCAGAYLTNDALQLSGFVKLLEDRIAYEEQLGANESAVMMGRKFQSDLRLFRELRV